MLTTEAATS